MGRPYPALSRNLKPPALAGGVFIPVIRDAVLVPKDSLVRRHSSKVEGVESVLHLDQLMPKIDQELDSATGCQVCGMLLRLISPKELHLFAEKLAALHKPAEYNWAAKFGLKPESLGQG